MASALSGRVEVAALLRGRAERELDFLARAFMAEDQPWILAQFTRAPDSAEAMADRLKRRGCSAASKVHIGAGLPSTKSRKRLAWARNGASRSAVGSTCQVQSASPSRNQPQRRRCSSIF